ncbi:hypothetical protein OBBRIDRAFT_796133 [Obba rivulosa]|uniref:Thioredoxin domain-containing protein n=1 Tax=Obba rivulosa TaxID=1052685 RepID=A0A8E2ASF8_9APHY|nr:hypothetical protein OBBRIDRAFT_796133 [Obba rivulosa]
MKLSIFVLSAALTPSLVSAALFPKDSLVKVLDHKGFKKAMKDNATSVVAFVAPWCGHCQRMVPEYSKAALGVYPMIPFYAVDCDKQSNKRLCAEQGVKGFPTVKLFPRGEQVQPIEFNGAERTASALYYFANRNIPHGVKKLYHLPQIPTWIEENVDHPRALLLNQGKGIPLLWQTLGNKYKDHITFAIHRDRQGKSSEKMGLEKGEPQSSKVLFYPAGSMDYIRYEGIQKHDSLSKFFDSIIDGTVDLSQLNEQAKAEEFVPDEEMLEIERKQEAQRIAIAHGGFSDLIDFEAALLKGDGADYHAQHGYPGMMGGSPPKKQEAKEKEEDLLRNIMKSQKEAASKEAEKPKMAKTGDAGQVVFEAADTGHARTPVAGESMSATSATPSVSSAAVAPSPETEAREEDSDERTPVPVSAEDPAEEDATSAPMGTERPKDEL